ncbi:MAG: efflux RND transporter periplasmic adaptor subunit [Candidatus Poribacteria bacterium]|nr:efflux RND transporter periplasmic adaptor subunit [Candidatus Poribacteria bacterium]
MPRYVNRTLYLIFIIVVATCFISINLFKTLGWSEDEKKQDDGHVQSEDESHSYTADVSVTLTDIAKANIGLKTAETDIRSIEKVVQVTGNIIAHPNKQAIVTPRIGGIVKQIHFKLGDSVKEGDVLLELESIDLQLAEIDLIEAVEQQKSLDSKLAKQKSVFAKQIRLELTTRQIDYLESLEEQQEHKTAFQKHRSVAIAKTISVLEKMRFDLIKADVDRKLLENMVRRTESLTEKRISAQKELISQKAAYRKAINTYNHGKREFQILGVNNQTLQEMLDDDGKTDILNLLEKDSMTANSGVLISSPVEDKEYPALRYVTVIEEATGLVDSETAYKHAIHKAESHKHRALATGISESHLDTIAETGKIETFEELSNEKLIDHYGPFMTSSEALEALLQTEEAQRNASILLEKVRRKLKVFGITENEIERIVETGKSHSKYLIIAPSSGQILKQHVTLGTTVDKSDSLYSILNTDVVWVEGEIYEDTLALVHDSWQIGDEVRIRVPAYPGSVFTGKISQISAVVDPEKRTVHFWTEVDNSNHKLKPGMFADQTLVIDKSDDVLSVPLSAVLEDGVTHSVFVESGNTYIKHEVAVGAKDDQFIEIKDGLLAGEVVVIQGTHQLMQASASTDAVVDPHAGHAH